MGRQRRKPGSKFPRLVWALAVIGLGAGALTHGLELHALNHIREERLRMKRVDAKALASLRALQTGCERVLQDLEAHFQDEIDVGKSDSNPVSILEGLSAQCEADLSELSIGPAPSSGECRTMREAIAALGRTHASIKDYMRDKRVVDAKLNTVWGQVESVLVDMQEATQKLDGRRRLRQEVLIRHFRDAQAVDSHAIASELVNVMGTTGNFRFVLSELSDLEILAQRLHATTNADRLVSLKDNQMRQSLNRLRRAAARADELGGANLSTHVDKIQDAVFGEGAHDDPAHQTLVVGANGLYSLRQRAIELKHRRSQLRHELVENGNACLTAERQLDRKLFGAINRSAIQAESTLEDAWNDALAAGVIVFGSFLLLSWKVAKLGRKAELDLQSRNQTLIETMKHLKVATHDAQAASRAKSEFLANMSHEIRTPMTAILGFADSLLDPTLSESERADSIQIIRRNGTHLLEIINDILDMSKIEAGKLEIEIIDTRPAQIVEEVSSLMQPRAVDKGISISVRYNTPIPERIHSDPTRLRQILLNLVGNAVKFTKIGGVRLHVAYDADAGTITFRVIDTGLGMTEEQVKAIARFDAFRQADGSTTRRYGGTGLGLRISNSLARMLGGGIDIQSQPGRGTTFTLTVATGEIDNAVMIHPECTPDYFTSAPIDSGEADSAHTHDAPLERLRILLAEDGPDNQKLISHHLRKAGANVTIANNGRVAVEFVEKAVGDHAFHVVLMDMQMPELDGYAATRQLRRLGCDLPIIALTAHAMSGDRDKCIKAGCADYLTKPIDKSELIRKCQEWAHERIHAACC